MVRYGRLYMYACNATSSSSSTYQFGSLCHNHIRVLNQSLEKVILGKGDDPKDLSNARENLIQDIQGHRIQHLFDDNSKNSVGSALSTGTAGPIFQLAVRCGASLG